MLGWALSWDQHPIPGFSIAPGAAPHPPNWWVDPGPADQQPPPSSWERAAQNRRSSLVFYAALQSQTLSRLPPAHVGCSQVHFKPPSPNIECQAGGRLWPSCSRGSPRIWGHLPVPTPGAPCPLSFSRAACSDHSIHPPPPQPVLCHLCCPSSSTQP